VPLFAISSKLKLVHYKTNSRVIRRVIRFGLVLELSGVVVRTIWLIVRIISSP